MEIDYCKEVKIDKRYNLMMVAVTDGYFFRK